MFRRLSLFVSMLCVSFATVAQQPVTHRPPAVPLVVNDPCFSVWSMADKLTDVPVKHWTETSQPMTGLIRIDNKTFRWMGAQPLQQPRLAPIKAMQQLSLEVTPLHTRYRFTAADIELKVTFFTASFPSDLDSLSRPVTYLSWSATSTDGAAHKVKIMLDVTAAIAVNDLAQPVTWGRLHTDGLNVLRVGTKDQDGLHQSGDRIRIDWGYFNLAIPDGVGAISELSTETLGRFVENGSLSGSDDFGMPRAASSSRGPSAHLATIIPFNTVNTVPVERHVLLAYTEGYAIEYLGRKLRPYWQRKNLTESAMLSIAEKSYPKLESRGVKLRRTTTIRLVASR